MLEQTTSANQATTAERPFQGLLSLAPDRAMKRRMWPLALGLGYILLIKTLGGLQASHMLIGSLSLLDAYNHRTRRFLKSFLPFLLTGALFDSMRYYYWQGIEGNVRVAEPYLIEKSLFGIYDATKGAIVSPNEFFEHRTHPIADLLCGFAYIFFIFEYLSCGFLLYALKQLSLLRTFGWCFLVVNAMGFATYFIYPAAPPWYITQYGLGPARMDVKPSAAAAARFDELLGVDYFHKMYSQGIDVYGSIPSLHVSYPLLVFWVAIMLTRNARLQWKAFALSTTGAFYLLMCFSAVYLQHHYVIDVVLGTLYALVALATVKGVETWRAA